MNRDRLLQVLLAVLAAAGALWFVTATEWKEVEVTQPAKGEATPGRGPEEFAPGHHGSPSGCLLRFVPAERGFLDSPDCTLRAHGKHFPIAAPRIFC